MHESLCYTISYVIIQYRNFYTTSYMKLRYRIITYDIVCNYTISYVIIRYRNLIYDIVYQDTISYNDVRFIVYDIVYDIFYNTDIFLIVQEACSTTKRIRDTLPLITHCSYTKTSRSTHCSTMFSFTSSTILRVFRTCTGTGLRKPWI